VREDFVFLAGSVVVKAPRYADLAAHVEAARFLGSRADRVHLDCADVRRDEDGAEGQLP